MRLKSHFTIGFVILVVILGVLSIWNVSHSQSNPHFIEIVVGMIVLSLLMGPISSLTDHLLKNLLKDHKFISTILLVSCISIVVFLLLHASTTPENISKEIPVTYLFNKKTGEMPPLRIQSTETSVCYSDARAIFNKGIDQDPNGLMKKERMLNASLVDRFGFPHKCFPDFTEYLIIYYLANTFSTPEVEIEDYRGETLNWFAIPHESIRGPLRNLRFVEGLTDENMFYDLTGLIPHAKIELRLPENTSINAEKDGFTRKIIIKNKFMKITISAFYMFSYSEGLALPHPSAFRSLKSEVVRGPFKSYKMFIRCEADFNKWRYSYPKMRYHERWAKDVFSKLERRFGWASPKMFECYDEQLEYYQQRE